MFPVCLLLQHMLFLAKLLLLVLAGPILTAWQHEHG
jgi:hypothetical protein